jgi:hypothetical protein
MHFARSSKNPIPAAEEEQWNKRTTRFVVLVFALNIISAGLLIALVHRPVYDDPFNVFDVHNYATRGLSMETLLSHRNPPGPTGFLWMAAGVRLLGGNELTDARIAVLVAWFLLAGGVLVGSRRTRFPQLWYGAFLATLVFPHAVEASATLLTEGPSLLFAVLGALAWTEFASEPTPLLVLFSWGCSEDCRWAWRSPADSTIWHCWQPLPS